MMRVALITLHFVMFSLVAERPEFSCKHATTICADGASEQCLSVATFVRHPAYWKQPSRYLVIAPELLPRHPAMKSSKSCASPNPVRLFSCRLDRSCQCWL